MSKKKYLKNVKISFPEQLLDFELRFYVFHITLRRTFYGKPYG